MFRTKNCDIFRAMSSIRPLIIEKTRCGEFIRRRRFRSTEQAKAWLRSEGCKFTNKDLYHIGDGEVELLTEDYEYSIQEDISRQGRRKGDS